MQSILPVGTGLFVIHVVSAYVRIALVNIVGLMGLAINVVNVDGAI